LETKIKRLYVLIGHQAAERSFAITLQKELSTTLGKSGVACGFQVYHRADELLNPWGTQSIVDTVDIQNFDPQAMLLVEEVATSWDVGLFNRTITGITLDASLYLPGQDTRIWRASVEVSGNPLLGEVIGPGSMKGVARKLASQLQKDGLI